METPFEEVTQKALFATVYGVSPHEVTTKWVDGKLWLKELGHRPLRSFSQASIWQDDKGWVHAEQSFYSGKNTEYKTAKYDKPGTDGAGWLWWPIFGDGLLGQSLLRPVLSDTQLKDSIRRTKRVASDKTVLGPALVYSDEDIPDKDDPKYQEYKQTLTEIGEAITHEKAVIGLPPWVKSVGQLFANSEALEKATALENHSDIQVLMVFGAQYLARGLLAPYGTNASSKTDATEQRNIRRFYINWLMKELQKLLDWFVEFNFGPQKHKPKLKADYSQELKLEDEVANWVKLRNAGGLSVSDVDESYWRKKHCWPAIQEGATPRLVQPIKTPDTPGSYDENDDDRDRQSEGDYT